MIPDRARLRQRLVSDNCRIPWQNDLPVSKHFTQRCLLIRSDNSHGLEIDFKILVDIVCTEIVFFQDR